MAEHMENANKTVVDRCTRTLAYVMSFGVIAAATLLIYVGINDKRGEIIQKIHEPERTVYVWRYDGSEYDDKGVYVKHYNQHTFSDDEDFKVVVQGRNGETLTVNVGEEYYKYSKVGDQFNGCRYRDDEDDIPEADTPVLRSGEEVEMKYHTCKQEQN